MPRPPDSSPPGGRRIPARTWIGVALIAVAWPANWLLPGLRTHLLFFPLWLGYSLLVDGWSYRRTGTSLWHRSMRGYVSLFVASAPAWWLFELVNWRTRNWYYLGRDAFTDLEYAVLATASFSTVIPAVFGTAELIASTRLLHRRGPARRVRPASDVLALMLAIGGALLTAVMLWPERFFPVVWLAFFFLIEPLNHWLGHRTLTSRLLAGDWRPAAALALGALACGFFWELWNVASYPKWIYRIPYLDRPRLFEMPIAGYGGYLPFGLELFALYHLLAGRLWRETDDYVSVG